MTINGLSMPKSRVARWALIHAAVVGFLWMLVGVTQVALVGQTTEQRFRELEKVDAALDKANAATNARIDVNTQRLNELEKINLQHRLSTLEAHSDTNRMLLIGISISITTLLVEMVARTVRSLKRKGRSNGNDN
jgi:hypothetical protein